MKKYIYFLFFAALLLVGCQREVPGGEVEVPVPQKKMEFGQVSLNFAEGDGVDTKSMVSIDAENFKKAYVFVFDANSKQIIFGSDGVTPMVYFTEVKKFDCELPLNYPVDIFTIVNYPESIEETLQGFAAINNANELSEADLLYVDSDHHGLLYTVENGSVFMNMNDFGIPMAGMLMNESIQDSVVLPVKRLYAKYEISLNVDDFVNKGYSIEAAQAYVGNSNSEVPYFYEESTFPNGYKQSDKSKLYNLDSATLDDLSELNNFSSSDKITFYVPENCQGSVSGIDSDVKWFQVSSYVDSEFLDYCTYIDFGLNLVNESTGKKETYLKRLYLSSNVHFNNDFNVIRNKQYRVNLTLTRENTITLPSEKISGIYLDAPDKIHVGQNEEFFVEYEFSGDPSDLIVEYNPDVFEVVSMHAFGSVGTIASMSNSINTTSLPYSSNVMFKVLPSAEETEHVITFRVDGDVAYQIVDVNKSYQSISFSSIKTPSYAGAWANFTASNDFSNDSNAFEYYEKSSSTTTDIVVNVSSYKIIDGVKTNLQSYSRGIDYDTDAVDSSLSISDAKKAKLYYNSSSHIISTYVYDKGYDVVDGIVSAYPIYVDVRFTYLGNPKSSKADVYSVRSYTYTYILKPIPALAAKYTVGKKSKIVYSILDGQEENPIYEFPFDMWRTSNYASKANHRIDFTLCDIETGDELYLNLENIFRWGGDFGLSAQSPTLNSSATTYYNLNSYTNSTAVCSNKPFTATISHTSFTGGALISTLASLLHVNEPVGGTPSDGLWLRAAKVNGISPVSGLHLEGRGTSDIVLDESVSMGFSHGFFPGVVRFHPEYHYYTSAPSSYYALKVFTADKSGEKGNRSTFLPSSQEASTVSVYKGFITSIFVEENDFDEDYQTPEYVVSSVNGSDTFLLKISHERLDGGVFRFDLGYSGTSSASYVLKFKYKGSEASVMVNVYPSLSNKIVFSTDISDSSHQLKETIDGQTYYIPHFQVRLESDCPVGIGYVVKNLKAKAISLYDSRGSLLLHDVSGSNSTSYLPLTDKVVVRSSKNSYIDKLRKGGDYIWYNLSQVITQSQYVSHTTVNDDGAFSSWYHGGMLFSSVPGTELCNIFPDIFRKGACDQYVFVLRPSLPKYLLFSGSISYSYDVLNYGYSIDESNSSDISVSVSFVDMYFPYTTDEFSSSTNNEGIIIVNNSPEYVSRYIKSGCSAVLKHYCSLLFNRISRNEMSAFTSLSNSDGSLTLPVAYNNLVPYGLVQFNTVDSISSSAETWDYNGYLLHNFTVE